MYSELIFVRGRTTYCACAQGSHTSKRMELAQAAICWLSMLTAYKWPLIRIATTVPVMVSCDDHIGPLSSSFFYILITVHLLWNASRPKMSADPASSVRRPAGHPNGGSRASSSGITDPGYALMRQHRKRANEYLGRALEIDESGHGEYLMHLSMYCPTYPPPPPPTHTGNRWEFDRIWPINMPQIRGIWSIFMDSRGEMYSPNGGIWS
jgi:hypothetical protein